MSALALALLAALTWSAPRLRDTTTASVTVRPFLHLLGPGWGALSQARVAYHFDAPLVLAVEAAPLALAVDGQGGSAAGAIAHLRLHAAYAQESLEIGLGLGGRMQRWGQDGASLAGTLRLGAQDGLHFGLQYVYSLVTNLYTRRQRLAFTSAAGSLAVPLGDTTALEVEGGVGFDFWLYGTIGLRQRLHGTGGPGTLDVRAGAGVAWVIDRFPCQYQDPTPCLGAAAALGPTLTFGVERRF